MISSNNNSIYKTFAFLGSIYLLTTNAVNLVRLYDVVLNFGFIFSNIIMIGVSLFGILAGLCIIYYLVFDRKTDMTEIFYKVMGFILGILLIVVFSCALLQINSVSFVLNYGLGTVPLKSSAIIQSISGILCGIYILITTLGNK